MAVKGYNKLLTEISITKILKTLRLLKAAAKENMKKEEWN
jgi:hypothetical protein